MPIDFVKSLPRAMFVVKVRLVRKPSLVDRSIGADGAQASLTAAAIGAVAKIRR
jgi:hypothetical protein